MALLSLQNTLGLSPRIAQLWVSAFYVLVGKRRLFVKVLAGGGISNEPVVILV